MTTGFPLPPHARRRRLPAPLAAVVLLGRDADHRVPRGNPVRWRRCYRPHSNPSLIAPMRWPPSGPNGSVAVARATSYSTPCAPSTRNACWWFRCRYRGRDWSRCVFIWVDSDSSLVRGHFQGYPKKLGEIWMTRPALIGRAGPRLAAGGRFGATVPLAPAASWRRISRSPERRERRVRERPSHAPPPAHAERRGGRLGRPSPDRQGSLVGRGNSGPPTPEAPPCGCFLRPPRNS